jgi:hypothetical protein
VLAGAPQRADARRSPGAQVLERVWRAAAPIDMLFALLAVSQARLNRRTSHADRRESMHLLAHVTEVEISTMVVVFGLGLLCGLAGGCGLGWFIGNRRK